MTGQNGQHAVQHLELGGGRIHVMRAGAGEELLFLHPAAGAGFWLPFHDLLAERFDVISPDHPGFGESDRLDWIDGMEDLVYFYLDLLDALDLEAVHVVGASLGGWLAAELAVHQPSKVRSLVMVDPIGLDLPEHPVEDMFAMNPDELRAALFLDQELALQFISPEPTLDMLMRAFKEKTSFARLAWNPFCCNPKLHLRLHRVTAPTLILWGSDDRFVPQAHGERYGELIAGARLEVIGDCGHAPLLEQPERTVEAIGRFHAELAGKGGC
ncbi:MAG: alpha/beta hydrolase [bacterium]|nr:alpha/beta hydrolase [bacterium]